MKRALITSLISLILLTVLGQLPMMAKADPMRPLFNPAAAASSPTAAANTWVSPPTARAGHAQPVIQTDRLVAIRRNGDGRAEALIGEHWVAVGGKAGNATVSRVDATSVTLTLGRQQQVLHVLPQLVATVEPPTNTAAVDAPAAPTRRVAAKRANPAERPNQVAATGKPSKPSLANDAAVAHTTEPARTSDTAVASVLTPTKLARATP